MGDSGFVFRYCEGYKMTGTLQARIAELLSDNDVQEFPETKPLGLVKLCELRNLVTEYFLATAPAAEEWRPISEAPKDGTKVLLYLPDDDDGDTRQIGYWSNLAARPGWFLRHGWRDENVPTHWRPLQPPPSER